MMRPMLRVALTATLAVFWHASAYAQTGADHGDRTRVLIIVLTVLAALLIGVLLYALAQRSSQVKFKEEPDDPALVRGREKTVVADPTSEVIAALIARDPASTSA